MTNSKTGAIEIKQKDRMRSNVTFEYELRSWVRDFVVTVEGS